MSFFKKSVSNLFLGLILVFCCFFLQSQVAAASNVYLYYADDTADAQILDIYQEMSGANGVADRWIRWRLNQYTGGGKAWDIVDPSYGVVPTLQLETTRGDFTLVDGSGDSGSWIDYTIGNIVAKRRDSAASYDQYSAYATYTVTDDYSDVYLGIHTNASVNGVVRVKINDVISSTGFDLDSNGEYDAAAHGTDNTNTTWIHINQNISTGDVIKIEVKGDTLNDRHSIIGLRFSSGDINPGDTNWVYLPYKTLTAEGSSQSIAIYGNVVGQVAAYMFGIAHINHEYSDGAISLNMDGTAYTLGDNLNAGDVISGSLLTAIGVSTGYGDTKTTDDFGTLTRTMTWQNNTHTQSWSLNFSDTYTVNTAYASMWPADNSSNEIFRYADMGSNLDVLLTNGVTTGTARYASTGASTTNIFYGGAINLKVTSSTTAPVTDNFLWLTNIYHKAYYRVGGWEKTWSSGETMGGATTTFTSEYQSPDSVDWSDKTLFIPRPFTIDDATNLLPFNGNNLIVKVLANADAILTFSGVAPTNTYFTSVNDDSVGATESLNSTGSPAAGDWPGIIVSGVVNTYNNILKYATTAIELQSSANSYNNTFDTNTTCINAANGSSAKNNAMDTCSTATTGAGTFDYNLYSGNTETNGVDGTSSFTDSSSGDYSLTSSSAGIDAGLDLGIDTDYAGKQRYDLPTTSNTGDVGSNTKDYVDIGAYEYVTPSVPTLTSSSHPSESTWYTDFTPDMSISSSTSSTISYKYLVNQDVNLDVSAVQAGTSDDDGIFTVIISSPGTWYVHLIAKNLDSDYSSTFDTYAIKLAASSPLPLRSYSTASSSSTEEKLIEEPTKEITECTLSDIAGHKYEEAIQYICDNKIVNGYDDGTYKPDRTINRAELLKIIIEAVFVDEFEIYANTDCFNDVPSNEWYTKYVCFAKEEGIVIGYFGDIFKPAQEISFVEALKIAMVGFVYDFEEATPWYKDIVIQASIFNFIPLDITQFNQYFTRGQMAELITRILKYESEDLEDYLGDFFDEATTYEDLI